MQESITNLATTIAADHGAVATLTITVNTIITNHATTTVQLVTILAANTTLAATITSLQSNLCGGGGGRGQGCKRGQGRGRGNLESYVGGQTGRFYCWPCGVCCYHISDI